MVSRPPPEFTTRSRFLRLKTKLVTIPPRFSEVVLPWLVVVNLIHASVLLHLLSVYDGIIADPNRIATPLN